ncbi:unnamed protein product, partial [Notodromas monacha]
MDHSGEISARWSYVKRVLERSGPLAHPDFEPSPDILPFLRENCKVLVVGAGGLGCELLKNLALMGIKNIDVIDMDTIDVSNLNRQFLFRPADVGKPKAEVAARFINERIPGSNVVPHYKKIQDYDAGFYSDFHIVVCGLDSIVARRWINGMLLSLLRYDDNGELDQTSIVPLVDGGTEGFKGNARVILPGMSACVECTLDLFPPQVNFPLCTIAHTPRLPEHCVEYVRVLLWSKENPFGEDVQLDGDDPHHVAWIYEKALERAAQFGITGVNYRLTQGVVKHIIPAVASTNAVIAAALATEVFKIAATCAPALNNYMVFNDTDGIYTYAYEAEKRTDCLGCSRVPQPLQVKPQDTLNSIVEILMEQHQMKQPGLRAMVAGTSRTLYMNSVPSIEEQTRPNLKKTTMSVDSQTDTSRQAAQGPSIRDDVKRILDLTYDKNDREFLQAVDQYGGPASVLEGLEKFPECFDGHEKSIIVVVEGFWRILGEFASKAIFSETRKELLDVIYAMERVVGREELWEYLADPGVSCFLERMFLHRRLMLQADGFSVVVSVLKTYESLHVANTLRKLTDVCCRGHWRPGPVGVSIPAVVLQFLVAFNRRTQRDETGLALFYHAYDSSIEAGVSFTNPLQRVYAIKLFLDVFPLELPYREIFNKFNVNSKAARSEYLNQQRTRLNSILQDEDDVCRIAAWEGLTKILLNVHRLSLKVFTDEEISGFIHHMHDQLKKEKGKTRAVILKNFVSLYNVPPAQELIDHLVNDVIRSNEDWLHEELDIVAGVAVKSPEVIPEETHLEALVLLGESIARLPVQNCGNVAKLFFAMMKYEKIYHYQKVCAATALLGENLKHLKALLMCELNPTEAIEFLAQLMLIIGANYCDRNGEIFNELMSTAPGCQTMLMEARDKCADPEVLRGMLEIGSMNGLDVQVSVAFLSSIAPMKQMEKKMDIFEMLMDFPLIEPPTSRHLFAVTPDDLLQASKPSCFRPLLTSLIQWSKAKDLFGRRGLRFLRTLLQTPSLLSRILDMYGDELQWSGKFLRRFVRTNIKLRFSQGPHEALDTHDKLLVEGLECATLFTLIVTPPRPPFEIFPRKYALVENELPLTDSKFMDVLFSLSNTCMPILNQNEVMTRKNRKNTGDTLSPDAALSVGIVRNIIWYGAEFISLCRFKADFVGKLEEFCYEALTSVVGSQDYSIVEAGVKYCFAVMWLAGEMPLGRCMDYLEKHFARVFIAVIKSMLNSDSFGLEDKATVMVLRLRLELNHRCTLMSEVHGSTEEKHPQMHVLVTKYLLKLDKASSGESSGLSFAEDNLMG